MRILETIFPVGALFLAIAMLVMGLVVYDYDLAVMNFPIFICVLTIFFSLVVLFQNRRQQSDAGPAISDGARSLALLLMAIPALMVLGFEIGLSLFLLFYLLVHRRGLLSASGLSAACFLLIYGLFEFYFHIPHFQLFLSFT